MGFYNWSAWVWVFRLRDNYYNNFILFISTKATYFDKGAINNSNLANFGTSMTGKMWYKQKIGYLCENLRLHISRYSLFEKDSTKQNVTSTSALFRIITVTPFVIIVDLIRLIKAVVCGIPFIPLSTSADPKFTVEILNFKIKIEIRHKEHAPPHFHVIIDDNDYSISIETGEFLKATRIKKRDSIAIEDWYKNNRELLIKTWNDSRPSDCPVGKIKVSP